MRKNLIDRCMLAFLFSVFLPLCVSAKSSDSFRQPDSLGAIILDSYHAAQEGVSSLSFSMKVMPENASDNVEFKFDQGIKAEVQEFRYDAGTQQMNIYVAGTEPLPFSLNPGEDGLASLQIGKVEVTDKRGNSRRAQVSIEQTSLQFVYGSEAKDVIQTEGNALTVTGWIGPEDEPASTPGAPTAQPPAYTPYPVTPSEPSAPQNPSSPSGGSQGGNGALTATVSPEEAVPIGTPVPVAQGTGSSRKPGGAANKTVSGSQESREEGSEESMEIPEPTESPEPSHEAESSEAAGEASASASQPEETDAPKESGSSLGIGSVLTGLGIGAAVLAVGAAVVLFLIRKPNAGQ